MLLYDNYMYCMYEIQITKYATYIDYIFTNYLALAGMEDDW